LSHVEIAKKRLVEYAETIGYRTTAETLAGVREIRLKVCEMSGSMKKGFSGVTETLQFLHKSIDDLRNENAEHVSRIAQITPSNYFIQVIQTGLYHVSHDTFFQRKLLQSPRPRTPLPYRSPSSSQVSGLLRLLGPRPPGTQDHLHSSLDLEYTLRKKYNFDDESIGRSRWLLTSPRFRDWLTLPDSAALVVHSYGEAVTDGRTSAMSVLCATLSSALLRQGGNVVILHFFCGLHADEEDGFSGPIGMIRSLAMQLLLSKGIPPPNLDFTTNGELMRDLDHKAPEAFIHVLEQLITQLPPDTWVYCLLDSPGLYDTRRNGWEDELRSAIRLLNDLVYDRSLVPVLKLLVTTPFRSDVIIDGMVPPDPSRYQDPAINLMAGQIDRRPLTEEAIITGG
jgi:hypothetical protein